jgi:hypothetical protein
MTIITQNTLLRKSSAIVIPFSPSATSGAIGAFAKTHALATGMNTQITVKSFQFSIPNTRKNKVESSTTPTCPQQ